MIVNTCSVCTKYVVILTSVLFLLGSCQKQKIEPETINTSGMVNTATGESSLRANPTTTQTTTCFSAIAQVTVCAGEWIRFSGEVLIKETRVTDPNGNTHITRSFSVHNLTGFGVTPGSSLSAMNCGGTLTNGALTGTIYTVAGGAEMFNIHFAEGGTATLGGSNTFVHRGTLVFVSNATGQHIVAIHIIRKVNGIVQENTWECH